jgi:uncharacterized membrane protein
LIKIWIILSKIFRNKKLNIKNKSITINYKHKYKQTSKQANKQSSNQAIKQIWILANTAIVIALLMAK